MPAPRRHAAAPHLRLLALVLFFCASTVAVAVPQSGTTPGGVTFDITAVPAWVKPFTAERQQAVEPDEGGIAYLLIDRQENLETQEYFYHAIQQISSDKGVQDGSAITATFDPAYQQLAFHIIRVVRNGTPLERLERSRIQLFQREKEMESSLYDGTYTARCELEDVRVGDVVEFAYTVRGVNPVMRGMYASTFATTWSAPVRRALIRILYPTTRELHFRARNRPIDPQVSTTGRTKEWLLDQQNIPGRRIDSDAPVDHNPHGQVEISEFDDWGAVVNWAVPLFTSAGETTPELQAEAERLRTIADPEQRILAALKFLQEEIRYVGIESGISSHQPAPPQEVLRRRFGDCKDKSVLLVWLLQRVGIDAAAALVSNEYRGTVPERLPSPHVFDHAIVQVQHGGTTHWLDPTRNAQRGPLSQLYVTNFRHALPVRAGVTGLVPLSPPPASLPRRAVRESIRVPTPQGTAELDVVTEYHGLSAERLRSWFRNEGAEQVQKSYLQFYARRYPTVEVRQPLRFEELPDVNACRVSEFYSVPEVWQRDEKQAQYQLEIWPNEIDQALGSVVSVRRDDPLALDHPVHITHEFRAEMFEPWQMKVEQREVANEFFRLNEGGSARGRNLRFTYTYEGRADRVPVAELQKYNSAVREARDKLGYTLSYSSSPVGTALRRFNWFVAIPFVLLLAFTTIAAICYFFLSRRRSPLPPPLPYLSASLEGLSGWLILPLLGMLARPIFDLVLFAQLVPTIFDLESWRTLTTPGGEAYHPLWKPTLLFELSWNGILFIFNLLLLALFFCKRAAWPRAFALFVLLNALGGLLDYYLASKIPAAHAELGSGAKELGHAVVAALIWIPYCFKSERVRATFRY